MREGKCGKHRILLFWKNHVLGLSGALLLWKAIDKGAYFGLVAVRIPLGGEDKYVRVEQLRTLRGPGKWKRKSCSERS